MSSDIRVVSVQRATKQEDTPIVLTSLTDLSKVFKVSDSDQGSDTQQPIQSETTEVSEQSPVAIENQEVAVNDPSETCADFQQEASATPLATDTDAYEYNPIDVYNPMSSGEPPKGEDMIPTHSTAAAISSAIAQSNQHKSAVMTPTSDERAKQQQSSALDKGTGQLPAPVDVTPPEFHSTLKEYGFMNLELAKFRFFLILDLNFSMPDAKSIKEVMTNYKGKSGESVSLFNPFRRRVTRKGKVVYPGGYLNGVIPEVVNHLTSVGQSPVFMFSPQDSKEQVVNLFLNKVTDYVLTKIDTVVDLNGEVFSLENGEVFRVRDMVSVNSWITKEHPFDDNGNPDTSITFTTLNTGIRVAAPEMVCKTSADAMLTFVNAVYAVLVNTLEENEAIYSDVVFALATNTAACFSNPVMTDIIFELVSASMNDGQDEEEPEIDEETGEPVESGSPFDFDVVGMSVLSIKDSIAQGADTIFPNDVDALVEVLGNKTEMVFCAYLPASGFGMEDEEDEEDEDDYDGSEDGEDDELVEEKPAKTAKEKGKAESKSKASDADATEIDALIKRELEKTLGSAAASKLLKAVAESEDTDDLEEEDDAQSSEDVDEDEIEEDLEGLEDEGDEDEDEDEDEGDEGDEDETDEDDIEELVETLARSDKKPHQAPPKSKVPAAVAKPQITHTQSQTRQGIAKTPVQQKFNPGQQRPQQRGQHR